MFFSKKWSLGVLFLFSVLHLFAQNKQYAFRVQFANKPTTFTLNQPLAYLSQRALDRRAHFSIALDSADLPVYQKYTDTVLFLTQGVFHNQSKWFNQIVILLSDSSKIGFLNAKNWIQKVDYIAYYPDGLHAKKTNSLEKDKVQAKGNLFKTTNALSIYGEASKQTSLVNGHLLHAAGYKGDGKLIAVLDAGFYNLYNGFDSLLFQNRIIDKYDFVSKDADPIPGGDHGSYVLSTMAGNEPGLYIGAAPHAQYALYRTEDNNSEQFIEMDNMVAALERADSVGADIATMSLGYNEFYTPSYYLFPKSLLDGASTLAAKALNKASSKGMITVAASGNEGGNNWDFLLTPGDADSALTVGTVDSFKNDGPASSPGPNYNGRIKPDVCMLGTPAALLYIRGNVLYAIGTSFAAPQLAAYTACVMQAAPNASLFAIKEAIRKSAHRYALPTNKQGYGVPDFAKALSNLGIVLPPVKENPSQIQITPNPCTDFIKITLPTDLNAAVPFELFSSNGALVYKGTLYFNQTNQASINLPDSITRGVYILSLEIDGQHQKRSFLKF
jgi:serine protease AprX